MPREAPLDAAGRAAAAAAAVPDPPEMPKKEKKKKVSWNAPDALVQVRWFKQVRDVSCEGVCSARMRAELIS